MRGAMLVRKFKLGLTHIDVEINLTCSVFQPVLMNL
jgi:hypothetical protein